MTLDGQEKQDLLEGLQKRSEFENKLVVKAYEDEAFRQELIANPKKIYEQELGTNIPDSLTIQVLEEQPNTVYMVLPRKAEEAGAEGELSDEALEAVAGGGWGIVTRKWFVGGSG